MLREGALACAVPGRAWHCRRGAQLCMRSSRLPDRPCAKAAWTNSYLQMSTHQQPQQQYALACSCTGMARNTCDGTTITATASRWPTTAASASMQRSMATTCCASAMQMQLPSSPSVTCSIARRQRGDMRAWAAHAAARAALDALLLLGPGLARPCTPLLTLCT